MRSTFHTLETAKRSLFTQQTALATTGHNIANANTAGYTRQSVNMVASRPIEAVGMSSSRVPGQLGTGVEFDSITRIRQSFLDDQFRNENKDLGAWEVRADTLDKLETIVNEPSDTGLRTVLENFWSSWSDLASNPQDITARKIVLQNAIALTDAMNHMSSQLTALSGDLTENINVKVSEINSKAQIIANLNMQIQRTEGLGNNANDLRDQRDLLVDELSKIANVTVVDNGAGYNVTLGGADLVTGNAFTPVTADALQTAYSSGTLTGGEVYGMIVSRDEYVADYQRQLDTLASAIATGEIEITIPQGTVLPEGTVLDGVTYAGAARTLDADLTVKVNGLNGLHQLGYAFNDQTFAQGVEFFTPASGTAITAASIRVNPVIQADPSQIATSMRTTGSGTAEQVVKGNNDLAMFFARMKDARFSFASLDPGSPIQSGTLDDYYRSIVGQLGVQSTEAQRQVTNYTSIVGQVDSNRQSVSGVSLDEEMSNMIKFQHAYNAAARVMTTVDEMLDRIINGLGRVGL